MTLSGPPERSGRGTERPNFIERRRQRILDEVARNRRGEYTVPTWVLALALVLMVGGWVALIILS